MYFSRIQTCLIGSLLIVSQTIAQKPVEKNDQFLYAVIELHQLENSNDFTVEFKAAQVINKKLRIPTRSEEISGAGSNYVRFQITDDAQNLLDEVIMNDPFNVSYEYVDEEGRLKQASVPQKSRSILIRRPISDAATNLNVQPSSSKRSNQSFIYKFR